MELTEKLLQKAGGWKAWKEAKLLHASGRIQSAEYQPPILKGYVTEGGRRYLSGLKILSEREIENLCACRDSRERGLLCAHSLAVGYTFLHASENATETHLKGEEPLLYVKDDHPYRSDDAVDKPNVKLTLEGSLRSLELHPHFTYEEEVENRFRRSGFEKAKGEIWRLHGEEKVARFIGNDLPEWEEEWSISCGPRWQEISKQLVRIEPQFALRGEEGGWLSVQMHYQAGESALFSNADIHRLLRSGQNGVKLKDGRYALLNQKLVEDIEESFRDGDPIQEGGRYRFSDVYQEYLEQSIEGWSGQHSKKDITSLPLGLLDKVLRPYQRTGAQWLIQRSLRKWGGLLADDMGLGKTVQTLAMMEVLKGLHLVVCPSSLTWNWQKEAERFLPSWEVRVIEGPNRLKNLSNLPQTGILVTSYALLRRDIDAYRELHFQTVVLDEAQHIKNPDSQNARSAMALKANARFILTGTPIENSVRDLWSLFQFVLPGYLGGKSSFMERYEKPLASGRSPDILKRLKRRIQPFILRRLKENVLKDLPEKLTQVTYCELTNDQKRIYESLRRGALDRLDQLRGNQGDGTAKMAVFTAILRLRQACCDLRLLGGKGDAEQMSAKLCLLMELLQGAQDGGHRVLIFSQFTSMLNEIARELQKEGMLYCRLDGTTKHRQQVVEQFQKDAQIPVFLISIKAGGSGLNLTAADTVIHFDPWWNPAVEAQATDRAHRIGQTRVVNVIKLVSKDTIEERVLKLQEKKRRIYENAFDLESATKLDFDDFSAILEE